MLPELSRAFELQRYLHRKTESFFEDTFAEQRSNKQATHFVVVD